MRKKCTIGHVNHLVMKRVITIISDYIKIYLLEYSIVIFSVFFIFFNFFKILFFFFNYFLNLILKVLFLARASGRSVRRHWSVVVSTFDEEKGKRKKDV